MGKSKIMDLICAKIYRYLLGRTSGLIMAYSESDDILKLFFPFFNNFFCLSGNIFHLALLSINKHLFARYRLPIDKLSLNLSLS
jgi:hypothetical protein